MKSFLLPILIAFCYLGPSCQVSAQTMPDTPAGPKFAFMETIHDFGAFPKDTVLDYGFTFTNAGSSALMIQSIATSCECLHVQWERKAIMPGESGVIQVHLPVDQDGPFYRLIWISSNATNNNPELGTFELSIKGSLVRPAAKKKHKGPTLPKKQPRTNF